MPIPIHPPSPGRWLTFFRGPLTAGLVLFSGLGIAAEEGAKDGSAETADATKGELKLPGLKIDLKKRLVDVDATVCLETGMLELVACTKQTKEHESIVTVDAKAAHIHAALLLLGAEPGNPAMRKALDEEGTRWADLPPRGEKIDVFLVIKGEDGKMEERPIRDFITMTDGETGASGEPEDAKESKFPTSTFLFAGSHLYKEGDGPPRYLSDESGNVISISTFGDELLCLPGHHAESNGSLVWEVDPTHLPPVDTKVLLRLKPAAGEGVAKPENPDDSQVPVK